MKALVYARVSSKKQRTEETIEYQLAECSKLVKDNGLTVIGDPVLDNGFSGTSLYEREFKNLIDLIDSGNLDFDVLVVYSVDRIFREDMRYASTKDAKADALRKAKVKRSIRDIAEIKACLITNEIKILEKGSALQSVSDELFSIKQTLAGSELRKIKERTADGSIHTLNDRKLPIVGRLPLGYTWKRNRKGKMEAIIRDPENAKLLNRIYRLVLDIGPKLTVDTLNDEGITTQLGKKWSGATLWLICKNAERYYTGNWEYRYQDEIYTLHYPPLIDAELYRAITGDSKSRRLRNDRRALLTTGTTECKVCGNHPIVQKNTNQTKEYLVCRKCKGRCHYDKFERALWYATVARMLQIAFEKGNSKPEESIADQIETAKNDCKAVDEKIDKLVELSLAGLDISAFRKANDKLQKEKLNAESKLLALKERENESKNKASQKRTFEERVIEILNEAMHIESSNLKRKRELLQSVLMGERVKVAFEEYYNPTITMPAYNGFDEFSFKVNENPFDKIAWTEKALNWIDEKDLKRRFGFASASYG